MSLNLEGKKEVVAEVAARLANAQSVVLAEYRGLEVGDMTQLRAKARASGVYLRVLKNTLARRAVAGCVGRLRSADGFPHPWVIRVARTPTLISWTGDERPSVFPTAWREQWLRIASRARTFVQRVAGFCAG